MKISTRTRYGIRAMAEIAAETSGKGVYQKDIAKHQAISLKYLDSIIQSLKTANLIVNCKGKKSGYILTRDPKEITMLDIHNAFENSICIVDCLSPHIKCTREATCNARHFWSDLNSIILNYFESITLQDMVGEKNSDIDIALPHIEQLKC